MVNLRCLRVIIVIMLILPAIFISPPRAEAASEAIGVNLILNNFLNNSDAKALAWLVFNGSKPSQSQVDNLVFKWYAPNGSIVFTDVVDPDIEAVAWSYYHVDRLGLWSVNVTYEGNTSIWNHKEFDSVDDHWGPGFFYVRRTTLISKNATLTIEPGTTVKFDNGKGLGVEGKLIARGTWSQPIILTSNLSSPTPGDWSSVTFFKSSNDSSIIDNVKIEYSREGLTLMETSPLVVNSTFLNNHDWAIYAQLSNSTIKNNTISTNVEGISPRGIYSIASKLVLDGNTIKNMTYGLYLLNSNLSWNANILMRYNVVENSEFYGMFVKNSIISSANDVFIDNNKGIQLEFECNTNFENLTIIGGLEGFTTASDTAATIWNSTVEETEIATFVLRDGSKVILINSTFNTSNNNPGVSIDPTDDSKLIIKNFLIVEVISYDNKSHLKNATVIVYDGTTIVHNVTTNGNGRTQMLIVTDRIYMPTVVENITRVNVSWANLTFMDNNRSVAMKTSHTETFWGSIYEFEDITPPQVISHSPTDPLVVLNIIITITFSEAMQNQTVEQAFSMFPLVNGTFVWSDNVFIFIPTDLVNNTLYTVTMGTGAKDMANNSLQSPYQFSFTTMNITDTIPPMILEVFPTGNNVSTSIESINITFTEKMQVFTTEPAFKIEPRVPGIFSWENNTLHFRLIFELSERTLYTVTINGSRASDLAGNKLDGNANGTAEGSPIDDYSWQFRTRQNDFSPPIITKVYPTGNMVDLNTSIRIYFNEAMNKTSIEEAFSYTNGTVTWTFANGSWGTSQYIFNFIPSEPFEYFQLITVKIDTKAKDLLGNTLDGNANGIEEGSPIDDFTWSFRPIYDMSIGLPTINEVSPVGSNISSDDEIYINFSQSMDQDSVEDAFTITDGVSVWDKDDGSFVWEENRTYFVPTFPLIFNKTYTVRINITAENYVGYQLDGNGDGIPEDYTIDAYSWSFKTDLPELIISYISVYDEFAKNQSKILYIDSGDIVPIGVNITNTGRFGTAINFNVSLRNMSGIGKPLDLEFSPLDSNQDSGTYYFQWLAPTSIGDHFVEIIIDWENRISERNEANNTFILHFAVGPDYVLSNITIDGMNASDPSIIWYADLGVPMEIAVETKNIGFTGVSSSITYNIAFWNSTSTGDLVGPVPFHVLSDLPSLGAGESSGYQAIFWNVTSQLQNFYITIVIDYGNSTTEIDEGNNRFTIHFAFSSDYAISSIFVDGSNASDPNLSWNATYSEPIMISVNATNLGLSGVADNISYNISFFNSTRDGIPLDEPFYKVTLPGLLSGENSGEVIGFWLPANVAGVHYVAVKVDSDNVISEIDENNNLFVLNFAIGPDIVPTSIYVNGKKVSNSPSDPIYLGPGEIVSIEVNASNRGFSGTGIDFYLALYNGTRFGKMLDQPYLNTSVSALNSSGSPNDDSGKISCFWPASLDEGIHYVIIYADISYLCDESQELNNYWVLTFVISPDLIPNNITVNGLAISSYANGIVTILPGQSILIGVNVSNIGNSSTGIFQFSMAFYNSTSSGVNLEPQFANWISLGPLPAHSFTNDMYEFWTAPYPTKPTDYYINISVDSDLDVSEADEGNNFYILHVNVNAPDLTPDRIIIEAYDGSIYYVYEDPFAVGFVSEEISIPLDTNITITFDVINLGGLSQTTGTNVTFYNTSSLFGPQNATSFFETLPSWVLLGGMSFPTSDQTSEVGQTMIVQWTNPGVYGKWYINISIDPQNNMPEFSDTNNTFTIIINITNFPITNLKTSGTSYSGHAQYVNSITELNLTVSGENPPFYTWYRIIDLETGLPVQDWKNYTTDGTNFTMDWGEGAFRVEYNSTDTLGNQEITRYTIVVVDDNPPQTNANIGSPKYRAFVFHSYNITSSTPITLFAEDMPSGVSFAGFGILNASGIKSIYYRIQCVSNTSFVREWTSIPNGFPFYMDPIWDDGYYLISYYSIDNLGDVGLVNNLTIYLDNTGPETTLVVDDPKHPHPTYDWYVTSSTLFTINANEINGSGANTSSIQFRIAYIDGRISSEWKTGIAFDIASSFMQGEGNYTVAFKSRDYLGNMQFIGVIFIYVDDSAPLIYLDVGEPKYREFAEDPFNITYAALINITAHDSNSGVFKIEYKITNASYDSGWILYFGEFNLTGLCDGLYSISYNATDNLGNSHTKSIEIYLDMKAPITTLFVGDPKHRKESSHIWNITSSTPISLIIVYEIGSGLARMEYNISNQTYYSGWQLYSNEFYLHSSFYDGEYTIHYRGVDNLNNTEEERILLVRLDKSAPECSLNISGIKYRENLDDKINVSSATLFIKIADDGNGSGVKAVFHRIFSNDTGENGFYYTGWLSVASFKLNLTYGNYTIEFYTVDNLSNAGSIGYLYVYLDTRAPESFITIGEPKYRQFDTDDWTVGKSTLFYITADDGCGSGVKGIYYSIWNDTNTLVISSNEYSQAINLSGLGGDGLYRIRFWSDDHLDNVEVSNELKIFLDGTSPRIIFSSPSGSGNSIASYIAIIFNEKVNPDSVKYAFSYTDGQNTWNYSHGTIKWNGMAMTFYPHENLSYGTTYTVIINATVFDDFGNRLDGDGNGIYEGPSDIYSWYFETRERPDDEPPIVIGVYPIENAVDVNINENIVIEFSEMMNEISMELAFSFTDGTKTYYYEDGIFTWEGNIVTFTPLEQFSYDGEYKISISNFASDISGNQMASDFIWTFKTKHDDVPPIVVSHSPSGVNVSIETIITVSFSKVMIKSSAESAFIIFPSVNGSFTWEENTLIFTPVSNLQYGKLYYVYVGTEAKDAADNVLGYPYQFSFTTEPDIYPPSVLGHTPTGFEVDLNKEITVIFNEEMQHSSVEEAFSIVPNVQGNFSWAGNTLIFIHSGLLNETTYTVTITTGAKDLAANALLSPYQFSFTTKKDPFAPYIIDVEPKGVDVPLDSAIRITFNEAMNKESVYSSFIIEPYVFGTFIWENNTLILSPMNELPENTRYNVTILNTASDLAGNSMAENYTWNFETKEAEPSKGEPTPIYLFLILFLIIAIVVLLVFYLFFYKKKKEPKEEKMEGLKEKEKEKIEGKIEGVEKEDEKEVIEEPLRKEEEPEYEIEEGVLDEQDEELVDDAKKETFDDEAKEELIEEEIIEDKEEEIDKDIENAFENKMEDLEEDKK